HPSPGRKQPESRTPRPATAARCVSRRPGSRRLHPFGAPGMAGTGLPRAAAQPPLDDIPLDLSFEIKRGFIVAVAAIDDHEAQPVSGQSRLPDLRMTVAELAEAVDLLVFLAQLEAHPVPAPGEIHRQLPAAGDPCRHDPQESVLADLRREIGFPVAET